MGTDYIERTKFNQDGFKIHLRLSYEILLKIFFNSLKLIAHGLRIVESGFVNYPFGVKGYS